MVVVCGGREVRKNVEGEEGASALRRPFGRSSRGLSRASHQSFRGPLPAQDGDDSQRVNRVIQARGTHCHYCYVWI